MGSAVSKSLARGRGKVDDLAVDSDSDSFDENVNDNCQPSESCVGDSLLDVQHLPRTASGERTCQPLAICDEDDEASVADLLSDNTRKTPDRLASRKLSAKSFRGLAVLERCFMPGVFLKRCHSKATNSETSTSGECKGVCELLRSASGSLQSGGTSQSSWSPRPGYLANGQTVSSPERNNPRLSPWPARPDNVASRRTVSESQLERSVTRLSNWSPRAEDYTDSSDSLEQATDQSSSVGDSSPVARSAHAKGLSPDQIGNIRKQLYTEALNPAEREGGVAFFIPVREDGIQPQADGAVVAERLTKTKKASLNYEERMILANVNRQAQLSKRKQFAVRDIRNVKGASSATDMTDRTKFDDGFFPDLFDASVSKTTNARLYLDSDYVTTVSLGAELKYAKSKRGSVDVEHDVCRTREEGS